MRMLKKDVLKLLKCVKPKKTLIICLFLPEVYELCLTIQSGRDSMSCNVI